MTAVSRTKLTNCDDRHAVAETLAKFEFGTWFKVLFIFEIPNFPFNKMYDKPRLASCVKNSWIYSAALIGL